MPLLAENVENSLVVSVGQYYGREYLPGWTGMDADTSEMVSALIMGVGGYKPVKAVGSAVGNRVLRPFDLDTLSVKNSLGRVFDYVAYVGTGFLVLRNLMLFQACLQTIQSAHLKHPQEEN